MFRALREADYNAIRDGKYNGKTVKVFYGCDNYKDDEDHINNLMDVVEAECPGVNRSGLTTHRVSMQESSRHAHMMVIPVEVKSEVVRRNRSNYTTL